MMDTLRHQMRTLRGRLVLGAFTMVALMGMATWVGYDTVNALTREMVQRFASVGSSASVGSRLEDLIAEQMKVGDEYLRTGEPRLAERFSRLGLEGHDVRKKYRELPDLTPAEKSQIEMLEALHSQLEVEYSLAHAILDLGDGEAAAARATATRPVALELQGVIRGITSAQADKLTSAADDLQGMGDERQAWLLVVLTLSLGLGTWIMYAAIRGIGTPLEELVGAAERFGSGDLRVQLDTPMLKEFDALKGTFNSMAGQLRTLVLETVSIAEQISTSAFDLSSISEEVAASSGEVATAMVEITRGAESQSQGLQSTIGALDEMGRRSGEIDGASRQVTGLSEEIQQVATRSRERVSEALRMLLEVRGVVQASGDEVRDLEKASAQIDGFVETIANVARQTNLLALNAAIEAARAGEHGRGFAVVAEEVRKLADGSAAAAKEVAQIVQEIRAKITGMVQTMDRGSRTVEGVEEVSRTADVALEQILESIGSVRNAAGAVAQAVHGNQDALLAVERSLAAVSETAESHAASAQEVSAAAEQQSAATEEMSASSAQLLNAADRMKELVSGLKV